MLRTRRQLTLVTGLVLLVVYSAVMMATSGSAAWAWLILASAVVMLVLSARGERAAEQHDG